MLAASGNADKDRSKIRDRDKGREGERREGRGEMERKEGAVKNYCRERGRID